MAITVQHGLDPLLFGPVAAFGQAGPRLEQGVLQQAQLDNQLFGQAQTQRQFANQVRQAEMERAQRGAMAYLQLASGNANQERDRQMRVGMAQQQMGFEAGSKQFDAANQNYRQQFDAANQNYRQNNLFEQQAELESMRQFGLDSRLGRQMASRELVARNANDTRMELQNQRLSASEMQRVNILQADIAELDRQFHMGAFPGPDGQQRYETARQNRILELGTLQRRDANSQRLQQQQSQQERQDRANQQFLVDPQTGQYRRNPYTGAYMIQQGNGNLAEIGGNPHPVNPTDVIRAAAEIQRANQRPNAQGVMETIPWNEAVQQAISGLAMVQNQLAGSSSSPAGQSSSPGGMPSGWRPPMAVSPEQLQQELQSRPMAERPGYNSQGQSWERAPHWQYTEQLENSYSQDLEMIASTATLPPVQRRMLEERLGRIRMYLMRYGTLNSPQMTPQQRALALDDFQVWAQWQQALRAGYNPNANMAFGPAPQYGFGDIPNVEFNRAGSFIPGLHRPG